MSVALSQVFNVDNVLDNLRSLSISLELFDVCLLVRKCLSVCVACVQDLLYLFPLFK